MIHISRQSDGFATAKRWRSASAPCLFAAVALAWPGTALAHAMDSGFRLLLPTGAMILGGSLAVAASVLIVAMLPGAWLARLFRTRFRAEFHAPHLLMAGSLAGLAALVALILTGFLGPRDPLDNLLPLTVWTIWWVGFTCLCTVFGNLWVLVEPWTGIFRLLGRNRERPVLRLPASFGVWPAILALMAFGWFENADIAPQDPARLATLATAYALGTLLAMALFGPEVWLARGECFSIFFGLVGRLAPVTLTRDGSRLRFRAGLPGHGLVDAPPLSASETVFVLVALATISFDGLSETFIWLTMIGINPLEFPGRSAVVTEKSLGFLLAWAALAVGFLLACEAGARWAKMRGRGLEIAGRLAASVLPIAIAYHFAHYLTAFLVNGQYWLSALAGDHGTHVTTSFLYDHSAVEQIWLVQSGAIVGGHVLAVLIAHACLGALFPAEAGKARRAGLPVAVLMVLYTGFGLWLLATPSGAQRAFHRGKSVERIRLSDCRAHLGRPFMTSTTFTPDRRTALKGLAAAGAVATGAQLLPGLTRYAQAQSSAPIRIGFQVHRTGIGAAYGRWYDRTTRAAAKVINEMGGINGREIEIVAEDDGTDPKRGAEVVEKFATQLNCDIAFGTLFSHVVIGSAPRAGELKLPYFVVSEGTHVSTGLNRWTMQPGITDVNSQVLSMAPFMTSNLGKKVTMVYPDYAFGYNHRDALPPAIAAQGGEVIAQVAIPPSETSFFKYLPKIPRDTEVLYHVMVGPGVLTFVKELGEFYGSNRPEIFGFIDSLEAVDINSPGLEFLDGTYFWEGHPRYAGEAPSEAETFYRKAVGVDANGASVADAKDVSTYGHMFGCWETLFVIKAGMEACGYRGPEDRQALIEAIEAMDVMPAGREHPQGSKLFNGKTHQVFGHQYISKVGDGKLSTVHKTSIFDGLYEDKVDYSTMSF